MLESLHRTKHSLLSLRKIRRVLFILIAVLGLSAFVAGGLSLHTSAQGNNHREAAFDRKADRLLKRIRQTVDKEERAVRTNRGNETAAIKRLSRIADVRRNADNTFLSSVAVTLSPEADAELKAAGFQVQSRIGDVATLEVDVDRLPDLAALDGVKNIFASLVRHPLNDRARQSAGVDDNSGQRTVTQTGQGVVVGIIDTGIDFRHLDFTVPGSGGHQTRIKALLDMTEYEGQSPDPGWNYALPGQVVPIGHLYTEAEINSALQIPKPPDQNADSVKQRDKNGHGTHVAGTAAGNGLSSPTPGTYAGMAPAADLVIVKANRQNDGEADFNSTDIINALEFVEQKAAELGKPFVINLSLGGQIGPHDGTNPDERAIDNLVNGGAGRSVCIAAGNEGDASIHARSTVPAGGSQTLDFNVNGEAHIVDLYQNNADRFRVTVTSPDGVVLGPVTYDANGFSFPDGQAANQYLEIFNANDDKGDVDTANDQPNIVMLFKPNAPNGMWKIKLDDADSSANQSYDAWSAGEGVYFSTFVDHDSHLIASPGTARGAITVGAFVTRSTTQTIGTPASSTSPGPTADGRQKPEISAPGYYLYSSRSTDIVASNFGTIGTGSDAPTDSTHYTGLAGTSMATPVTTGSVALLIQSSPNLSASEIKSLLTTYAALDIYTGSTWGPRFGFGKLNIANSINRTGGGLRKYSISGRLADPDGTGVFDLQIFLSGAGSAMARTDANGNFSFNNLTAGGNYTVAPSLQTSMAFSPESYTFNNLHADQTANFVRTVTATYNVHGRVTDTNGNGVSGIRIEFPGSFTPIGHFPILPATTDINGYYQADLPKGQDYHLTPTSDLYSFTPVSIDFLNLSAGQTANFLATSRPITLSGQIIYATSGLADVSVTISAAGATQSTTVFSDANGWYTLSNVSSGQLYTITPSKSGYLFEPSSQTLYLYQGTQPRTFIATAGNPIDNARFFVTQHYRDFLNREPDESGLSFWTNGILACGSSVPCVESKRVNTSAAFFLSIEFQETGYLAYRMYKASYGDVPGTPVPVTLGEFLPDTRQIGSGVIVGETGWQQKLAANKVAFTQDFVTRSRFTAVYPSTMTPEQFVNALYSNAGVNADDAERTSVISEFGGATTIADANARARALSRVAENSILRQQETNKAFVLMQYFGYLRRNPNDAPELNLNFDGYNYWLNKLNLFNGNFVKAEMVNAFIVSDEYRNRFTP